MQMLFHVISVQFKFNIPNIGCIFTFEIRQEFYSDVSRHEHK